jgi:hypothetical protein
LMTLTTQSLRRHDGNALKMIALLPWANISGSGAE